MQLFVNDLTVIDFSYCCSKRGIVGESWIVDVLLDGSLNEMSMVLDFAVVKKQIKAIIDDAVDHKLLLPINNKMIECSASSINEDHEFVDVFSDRAHYFLQSPKCAFAKVESEEIDIASVTKHLTTIILKELPKNVQGLTLTLRPENIDGDFYHYTHGLKLHDGNCQRIAHGHRSKIHIYRDGKRDNDLENKWALKLDDCYIGTTEDIISQNEKTTSFAYESLQGKFNLSIPSNIVHKITTDSTVEHITSYLHKVITKEFPGEVITVKAYECVGKGAIA